MNAFSIYSVIVKQYQIIYQLNMRFPKYYIEYELVINIIQIDSVFKQKMRSTPEILRVVTPAKFLAIMLHLIVTTMNYFSYHDNILATYPSLNSMKDDLYVGARVSVLACTTLTVIFITIEIIILLSSRTMFNERQNIFNTTLHSIGAILYSMYIFQKWNFSTIWAIWFPLSLLPLITQIISLIFTDKK